MRSIDIREANALPKSAKALADQVCGCGNGSEDITIPRRVVRRGGSRKNPEHRRMFTGKRIRRQAILSGISVGILIQTKA